MLRARTTVTKSSSWTRRFWMSSIFACARLGRCCCCRGRKDLSPAGGGRGRGEEERNNNERKKGRADSSREKKRTSRSPARWCRVADALPGRTRRYVGPNAMGPVTGELIRTCSTEIHKTLALAYLRRRGANLRRDRKCIWGLLQRGDAK
jgi:hypothetical protein